MKNIILSACLLSFSLALFAQKDTTKNLELNQVEVIKSFEAILEEAKRINIDPAAPQPAAYDPKFKYDITILPADLKYPDPQIKPLAMDADPPFKVNHGYLYAGYGSRKNPRVSAGYHVSRKDSYDLGAEVNFESLDNSSKVPYQKLRNAGVGLYGHYMVRENLKVFGNVSTDFRKRYFYHTGLNVDSLFSEESSARNLNSYHIKAGISNVEPTRFSLNYNVSGGVRKLAITNADADEGGIFAQARAEKLFGEKTVLSLNAEVDYTSFSGNRELSLTIAQLRPMLKTKIGLLTLSGGASILSTGDKGTSVFPEILVSYGLENQKLQVFAGLGQEYFANNLTNITKANPFISTSLDSLTSTVFRSYYGGIRGRFLWITYEAKAGWKDVKGQVFMLNNSADPRIFNMNYDDTGIFFISGSVDLSLMESLSLGGMIQQNILSLDNLAQPWHTPTFQGSAFAKYTLLDDKLQLRSDLFLANGVHYLDLTGKPDKTDVLFDLNVSVEYSITEKLKVYLTAENLVNNKYQRWYGYPIVGTNVIGGLKVVF